VVLPGDRHDCLKHDADLATELQNIFAGEAKFSRLAGPLRSISLRARNDAQAVRGLFAEARTGFDYPAVSVVGGLCCSIAFAMVKDIAATGRLTREGTLDRKHQCST
jgi:hypothetical protein